MRFWTLSSLLYATSWLVRLSLISLCTWIVLRNGSEGMKSIAAKEPPMFPPATFPMPEVRRRGKATVWISSMILGILLGYAATLLRDEYWPSKIEDFLIIANSPDGSHVGVDKYGRERSAKWCSGPDDLIPGNRLPVVYYRQMPTCKIIHGWFLGYSVYSYKDGTRMIFPIPKETANAR